MSVVIAYLMVCSLSLNVGVPTADEAGLDQRSPPPSTAIAGRPSDDFNEALDRALRGFPALAAVKLSLDWSPEPTCDDLIAFTDLMVASRSERWMLRLVSEPVLEKAARCGHSRLMLAWARSQLQSFDPNELPAPDQMLREEVDSVEFVHDDEALVLFEFGDNETEVQGPRKIAPVTFEVGQPEGQALELELSDDRALFDIKRVSSGALGHHFDSYLSTTYQGVEEYERRFLWATLEYLRGERTRAEEGFKSLREITSDPSERKWSRLAEVGLARLAFDQQRFADSFALFEVASLQDGKVLENWLPELVWSAYFAGRDDFLNQLFEWISDGDIHPIALGDALGLVPRILEEQCRRDDALKVTGYLIDAMRSPPDPNLLKGINPFQSIIDEFERSTESWLTEHPYVVTLGWLRDRAQREETTRVAEALSRVEQGLAQLLRTRIDMRLGRGLMRCRL